MNLTGSEACNSNLSQGEKGQTPSKKESRKRKSDSCDTDNTEGDQNDKKNSCDKTNKVSDSYLSSLSTLESNTPSKCPDNLIIQLTKDLKSEEERLRKLKMVKSYREKNNLEELEELIGKWRNVCQESLQDLQEKIPPPQPTLKQLLDHLQIEHSLVHFDPDVDSFS